MAAFSDTLQSECDALWQAMLRHPFVAGIGDGSLARDKFEFYLKQDYVYLVEFSRVFALASAKARELNDMSYFAKLLDLTLNTEMDLHRRICAGFGIPADELEKTAPALTTLAYTSFLVKTCYEQPLAGIIAVLLPCAWGYAFIGQNLKAKGLPQPQHYRDWIETYASDEFGNWANWLKNKMDELDAGASEKEKAHWSNLYETSARFELLFFEMGWRKEGWPKLVP
jgi:thiaminase/transcriptional activator TenA